MLYKSAAAISAGLAIATHAFVIVPDIAELDKDLLNSLPFDTPQAIATQPIKLSCPGCPVRFTSPGGEVTTSTEAASHLDLTFTVEHRPEMDRLLVNGFEIYPDADPFHGMLAAAQVLDVTEFALRHGERTSQNSLPLGFSLGVQPIMREGEAGNQNLELIGIDLQIIEVGDSFVDGIPNINVKLVKNGGRLAIAKVETTESTTVQPTPLEETKECSTLLCKWRALVADKIAKLKTFRPCGGRRMRYGQSNKDGYRHFRQHRHHQHHSFGQLLNNITSHILLPVLIGILAGVTVSILGMVVGSGALWLYRTFIRRQPTIKHCRRHSRHKSSSKEIAVAEEKYGLVDHQDLPPSYEEQSPLPTATAVSQV